MKTVHISCALGVGGWRSRSREIRRALIRQQHQATRHSVVQQEAIGLRNTTVIAQILKQAHRIFLHAEQTISVLGLLNPLSNR